MEQEIDCTLQSKFLLGRRERESPLPVPQTQSAFHPPAPFELFSAAHMML
jgi:hypothetical protein